ncbi:MAG: short-chain dehydrogenase [Proteobacteria bacterium]|nr:MAG: short-chain dehydrogenase [Pseudomonadota bacterium]
MFRRTFFALLSVVTLAPLAAQAALEAGSPTVLITGANRGLGLELARQYAERGWNVIATTRRSADDPGAAALREIQREHPRLVIERIDVTDTAMIRGVAEKYRDLPLDVLINNAAAVEATLAADLAKLNVPYDQIDFDAALNEFSVNTLGPMRMAQAFMPHVKRSQHKKIVNVTSLAGSFGRGFPGAMGMNYGASKAGLNKYSVMLADAVREEGVIVALVQPYFVATKADMEAGQQGAISVEEGASRLIKLIDEMTAAHSGIISNFQTGETDPF